MEAAHHGGEAGGVGDRRKGCFAGDSPDLGLTNNGLRPLFASFPELVLGGDIFLGMPEIIPQLKQ